MSSKVGCLDMAAFAWQFTDRIYQGLLLRVAKVPKLGQVTKYDYLFQQQFFQTAILPILGAYAVHQELVILHKSGIVEELNALLQHINHERESKFRDSYVGLTGWGLLVEDMRPERKCSHPTSYKTQPNPYRRRHTCRVQA